MSFLGPLEALWPVVELFVSSRRNRAGEWPWKAPEPPPRPVWKPTISTWEKANSVKPDRVTFTWMTD